MDAGTRTIGLRLRLGMGCTYIGLGIELAKEMGKGQILGIG